MERPNQAAAHDVQKEVVNMDKLNLVKSIVGSMPATSVKAREFFISWSGVATLAYEGFSPVLLDIKEHIETGIPGIAQEKPGAKWPKTTLGALKNGVTCTRDDAYALRDICDEMNKKVAAEDIVFEICELAVVVFQCRSLEKRLMTAPIALRNREVPALDDTPPKEHLRKVERTMAQFARSTIDAYLKEGLQREGNREDHYRVTHIESTLVFDLLEQQPRYIQEFIDAVNLRLPGHYCWFAEKSRHMTVRGLTS